MIQNPFVQLIKGLPIPSGNRKKALDASEMIIQKLKVRPPIRCLTSMTTTSLTTYHSSPPPSILLYSIPSQSSNPNNSNEQRRKANLGKILDHLRSVIPEALHTTPDSTYLDEGIILRVAPTITNLPLLKGRVSYLATLKATQFIMTNFLLNPKVKLHITDIKTLERGDFSTNLNSDGGIGRCGYGLYDWSTKIVFKWRTCLDECEHLVERSSSAKQGSHILNKFDIKKLWGSGGSSASHEYEHNNDDHVSSHKNFQLDGVKKYESSSGEGDADGFERVVYGIFVFELDKECEKIIVHNVENIEMYDKKNFIDNIGGDLARV